MSRGAKKLVDEGSPEGIVAAGGGCEYNCASEYDKPDLAVFSQFPLDPRERAQWTTA